LQLAYCDERKKDGHLYYDATSDPDLELKVERLRNELAEPRRAFNLWQNKVLRAFAVVFVLLVLIGGSVWWFGFRQHHEIQEISAEARHITREKIGPSCSSPPSASIRQPSPRWQRPRAGRNASASAKRPNRPMLAGSPA